MKKLLAGILGIFTGLATFYLVSGWYSVFPWAVAVLVIGYASTNRRDSIINGAIFGYILFLVYILLGYQGKTDTGSIIKFIAFNVLFSLVGAIAGIIGAFMGNWLKRKIRG